jgi:hypothetical protein
MSAAELALDGSGVAQDAIEAFGVCVVGSEQVVTVEEPVGFDGAGAPEAPDAVGDVGDQLDFKFSFGFVFGEKGFVHAVELRLVFAGEDDLSGGESVFEGVAAGTGFAEHGAGSGGVRRVELVAQGDVVEFAVELLERTGHNDTS